VGHALRSSSLLSVEATLARVSQSGLKAGRGATTGGARDTIAEEVEDGRVNATGCVGPCYPTFAVFNVLGSRGILII
jgi:hypothetical protein